MRISIETRTYKERAPFLALGFMMVVMGLVMVGPVNGLILAAITSAILWPIDRTVNWYFFGKFWPTLQQAVDSIWDDQKLEDFYVSHPQLQTNFSSSQEFIKHWRTFREQIRRTTPQPLPSISKCGWEEPSCNILSVRETAGHQGEKVGNIIFLKLSNGREIVMLTNHSFQVINFRAQLSKE